MSPMITAVAAFLLDTIIGDPRSKLHPVVLMGKLISTLESFLRRDSDKPLKKIIKGGALVYAVVIIVMLIGFGIELLTEEIPNPVAQILAQALVLSFMIAPRTLSRDAYAVYLFLITDDMEYARKRVSWIVGRDTENLNEAEITRATVETVSENTVDGVISPLFYFAIGGLPLAMFYRAANTMDSMIAYKNSKYFFFGQIAARLDDILNYVPARITALLFICAAFILQLDYKNAFAMMKRDAKKHPSPNGGYAEATVAGALNIRLGGTNYYFGEPHFRAYMGEPNESLEAEHILGAIRLMYTATILFLMILCLIP